MTDHPGVMWGEPLAENPVMPGVKTSPVPASASETSEGGVATIDREAVLTVVDIMRPAIQADERDIFSRDADLETGIVSVELTGACVTCPASTATLKDGIERVLQKRVEGVTAVQHVGDSLSPAQEGTIVSL
jgi:Fe-S cluster biogenesis protein NfuA